MPIHDWTRVTAGTLHDFHLAWIAELRNALNGGLLPPDYYAQAEQIAGPLGPDVLTLHDRRTSRRTGRRDRRRRARRRRRPAARRGCRRAADMDDYVLKRRTLVIRHASGDRIVALIEVVSPGNKASRHAVRHVRREGRRGPYRGYHLLVVDLFPPGPATRRASTGRSGPRSATTRSPSRRTSR